MLLLYLLIQLGIQSTTIGQLNMYHTENHLDRCCLLLFNDRLRSEHLYVDEVFIPVHQIISYCLRLTEETDLSVVSDLKNVTDPSFTFTELKQKNITSQMLLSWSATIDLAEQYEIFLIHGPTSLSTNQTFYNCTSLWFGPFCQFKFYYSTSQSFDDIVKVTFDNKRVVDKNPKVTCYIHVPCKTFLLCLDWREICDGKIDCFDRSDEGNCWQLEANQCTDNEYRCRNGQCIPIEFSRDIPHYPDCLDRTDEWISVPLSMCYSNPTFPCEEHMCRSGNHEFPCGDGECTNGIYICANGRSSIITDDFCSNAALCLLQSVQPIPISGSFCLSCKRSNCIKKNCTSLFELRFIPPILGQVRLVFSNAISNSDDLLSPDYVCYDEKVSEHFLPITHHIGNLACRHFNISEIKNGVMYGGFTGIIEIVKNRFRSCLPINTKFDYCNHSIMYQCKNSIKCIPKQRLVDGFQDCPENDDEKYEQSCSLNDVPQRFQCYDGDKCFASSVVLDGRRNCKNGEDEILPLEQYKLKHIYFPIICDGEADLSPILIDGKYETDETNCKSWPCDNIYTRCNQLWNCNNGVDEMHCPHSIDSTLRSYCRIFDDTRNMSCLSANRTDQRNNTHLYLYSNEFDYFHCWDNRESNPYAMLCGKTNICPWNGVAPYCGVFGTTASSSVSCNSVSNVGVDLGKTICIHRTLNKYAPLNHFKLRNMSTYPFQLTSIPTLNQSHVEKKSRSIEQNPTDIYYSSNDAWRCNRGVSIVIQMDFNRTRLYCLCPPSYYGDECQYQNQRVSITVQIRVLTNWIDLFIILLTLIDNEKSIQSYDYIQYLPSRDCNTKYNIYLLYSTRPKTALKNYSIQIDVHDQLTFEYRASWIYPLQFTFLPVHRLPVLLKFPKSLIELKKNQCWPPCVHGQCLSYINNQILTYCYCESGWSGVQCNIKHICNCASGSLCISNSICLCQSGRYGPRCHLIQLSCQSQPCANGGQCVMKDIRYRRPNGIRSMCICPKGYIGDHCEYRQNQTEIDLSFDDLGTIPSSLLIHFISVEQDAAPIRTSIMRKIPFDEYSITISTSVTFHMAFAQFVNDYYLIALRENAIKSEQISTKIVSSYRCRSIVELFDEIFSHQHLLQRIKYYHIPCRTNVGLNCFYDDIHICLCTRDRQANCFEFDHNVTYDCAGLILCENQGNCFLDDNKCPTSAFCTCNSCFFGSKCQFSTKGSTLSLDIILGYHIRSNIGLNRQKIIVKIGVILTTIIFVLGSINSFFSFQTFKQKHVQKVGCGLYLYASSIFSMVTVILLALKFSFLLISRSGSINRDHMFFYIQCLSIDFLLRCLLSINDWLYAFVAIERAVNVCKGVKFSKTKSKQVAKSMVLIMIVFVSFTFIYDPFHRYLIYEEEEQRTWCLSKYSPATQTLDLMINIFHFSFPFFINLISALTIIFFVTRIRSISQKTKSYKKHLFEQVQSHKHLLISPAFLVGLAIPRLIISLLSGCMKSARDSWLYLIGYFISFAPSIQTFVIFVLPSELYKNELKKSIIDFWK